MEILSKITAAIGFAVVVIIVSAVLVFAVVSIEFRVLTSKRKRIQENLTKSEIRLIELTDLVDKVMVSANEYSSELSRKRQELRDRKCNCTPTPANSTENQIE